MRHLYRITSRHGVDLVAADDAIQALGAWEAAQDATRDDCGPIEGDTAQCEQVDDEERLGHSSAATWAWDCLSPQVLHPDHTALLSMVRP